MPTPERRNALRAINPSVKVENGKKIIDPSLDLFDPKNGYNPSGPSHFSKEFQNRYFAAQAVRMNALIDWALGAQARMKTGDYPYPDDDIVIIPSGGNPGAGPGGGAELVSLDPSLDIMGTMEPEKLLKNDGTIVTEMVHSVGVAEPNLVMTNSAFDTGTKVFTIKSFLSANATRDQCLRRDRLLLEQ